MLQLVHTFFDIALWRKGPQDLPASTLLLTCVIVCYALASTAQAILIGYSLADSLIIVVVDIVLTYVLFLGVLEFFGFGSRLRQTLSATFGAGTLLAMLDMGVRMLSVWFSPPREFEQLLMIMLLVASLLVLGRIAMHALERGLLTGMALTVAMAFCINAVGRILIGPFPSST